MKESPLTQPSSDIRPPEALVTGCIESPNPLRGNEVIVGRSTPCGRLGAVCCISRGRSTGSGAGHGVESSNASAPPLGGPRPAPGTPTPTDQVAQLDPSGEASFRH